MELHPYIFFYGRCNEALEFYKKALGGSYESTPMTEMPGATEMPPDAAKRVMHAHFTGGGVSFMASDGRETKTIDPEEGNISLSLTATDAAEGERLFKAFAEGGSVKMPLETAFWGGRFGMVVDPFGIEWMFSVP